MPIVCIIISVHPFTGNPVVLFATKLYRLSNVHDMSLKYILPTHLKILIIYYFDLFYSKCLVHVFKRSF